MIYFILAYVTCVDILFHLFGRFFPIKGCPMLKIGRRKTLIVLILTKMPVVVCVFGGGFGYFL